MMSFRRSFAVAFLFIATARGVRRFRMNCSIVVDSFALRLARRLHFIEFIVDEKTAVQIERIDSS